MRIIKNNSKKEFNFSFGIFKPGIGKPVSDELAQRILESYPNEFVERFEGIKEEEILGFEGIEETPEKESTTKKEKTGGKKKCQK